MYLIAPGDWEFLDKAMAYFVPLGLPLKLSRLFAAALPEGLGFGERATGLYTPTAGPLGRLKCRRVDVRGVDAEARDGDVAFNGRGTSVLEVHIYQIFGPHGEQRLRDGLVEAREGA
ncbi:hypothetical protein K438DRAFT_1763007 [Mycena galopus ATCC 62051]|nr:hypothetical protein K438DRAFT_1763007 [Mycena galopus ATCC 62051]